MEVTAVWKLSFAPGSRSVNGYNLSEGSLTTHIINLQMLILFGKEILLLGIYPSELLRVCAKKKMSSKEFFTVLFITGKYLMSNNRLTI